MASFSRNVDDLVDAGFRVLVPDLPGYGRSSKRLDQGDPFGDLALAMRGLLDALDLERAHLVGNSYGGGAALRLALDRPDRVDRMVLMGPGGIGTTRWLPTEGVNRLIGYYGGDGPSREKMADFVRNYLVAPGTDVPDSLVDVRYQASLDPEVVANPPLRRPSGPTALRTLLRMDLARDRRLSRCEVPTLVLWGSDDRVNRPAGGPLIAHAMPRADLYLAAGVGHWVQFERPALFARLVTGFLRREDAA